MDGLPDSLKPLASIVYIIKLLVQHYQTNLTIVPINNTRAIIYGKIQTQPFAIDMLKLTRNKIELVQYSSSNSLNQSNQSQSN